MNIHKLNAGEVPYTCLPNDGINVLVRRDPLAFAIWGYLLSKPADWVIHPAEVMQTLGIGKTKYRLAMLVLKEEGYALRTPIIGDGHLSGSRLAICAIPNTLHDEVVNESQAVDSFDRRSVDSLTVGTRDSLIPRQSHFETVSSRDSLGNGPLTKERSSTKERKNTKERERYIRASTDSGSGKPNPEAKNTPDEYAEEFEAFWKEYPHKAGKLLASKTWKRLKDDEKAAIKAHLALNPYAGRAKKHIPHGSTYLNQKKWEDEVDTTNNRTGSMYA